MPANDPPIVHWTGIESADDAHYPGDDERMSIGTDFGRHFGFTRLGIHHERLPPGRRTSYPHAESTEEEFVFVIEGTPDVWLDGRLHRLKPGDAVGFPPAAGVSHSFLNNTDREVRLLVVGDMPMEANRIWYPRNPERQPLRADWWHDHPEHDLGDHDGLTDLRRAEKQR